MTEPDRSQVSAAMAASAELMQALAPLAAQETVTADQLTPPLQKALEQLRRALPGQFFDIATPDSAGLTDSAELDIMRGAGTATITVTASAHSSWSIEAPDEPVSVEEIYDYLVKLYLILSRMQAGTSALEIYGAMVGAVGLLLAILPYYLPTK